MSYKFTYVINTYLREELVELELEMLPCSLNKRIKYVDKPIACFPFKFQAVGKFCAIPLVDKKITSCVVTNEITLK